MPHKSRVLIADDSVVTAQLLGDRLAQGGYECEVASSGDNALDINRHHACNVVICDVRTEGMGEFKLLDQIKILQPQLPVIVGTARISILEAVEVSKSPSTLASCLATSSKRRQIQIRNVR